MTEKTTVVNAERFSQGFAYPDYLAQIKVNQDRFARYYDTASDAVTDEDTSFFKKAVESGCSRVLVLGEDWCPDVYRGMPVIGRISEVSGMEMRVFPRDENLDIADAFLNKGEFRSIPTLVFYNADQEYLCHWIERPEQVTTEMAEINQAVDQEMAGQDEQAVREARRERVNARFPDWQKETVRDLRELLSSKLGI
jgi:thiol-disulfide isomerase/thioredoxin